MNNEIRNRWLSVTYCDDIRQEVGGKHSLMGIYASHLYVAQLPAALSKLCVLITATTPADDPFKTLVFRVFKGKTLINETKVSEEQLTQTKNRVTPEQIKRDSDLSDDGIQSSQQVSIAAILAPMLIEERTMLRVRVETEREMLRGSGLYLEMAPG